MRPERLLPQEHQTGCRASCGERSSRCSGQAPSCAPHRARQHGSGARRSRARLASVSFASLRPCNLLGALLAALTVGCSGTLIPPGGAGGGGGEGAGGGTGSIARSSKNNLRFKGDVRLAQDLSSGLGLPVDQLCLELGQYPCTSFVHQVALGGVDPYGKGLYEGALVTGVTTPVVVDRVVLAGCVKRVDLDLASPAAALIFRSIALTGGKLADPSSPQVRLALTELAHRAWLRDPTASELEQLTHLHTDIVATGVAAPGKAWMQAVCFAAFSSAESVFY